MAAGQLKRTGGGGLDGLGARGPSVRAVFAAAPPPACGRSPSPAKAGEDLVVALVGGFL